MSDAKITSGSAGVLPITVREGVDDREREEAFTAEIQELGDKVSMYLTGKYYLDSGNREIARMYLKQAYLLGMSTLTLSVCENIYKYHIPATLATLCYEFGDYELGEECAAKALEHTNDQTTRDWYNIFCLLNYFNARTKSDILSGRDIIFIVAPNGWEQWDGETLRTRGLGGSENFVIGYGEALSRMGYVVVTFCNCRVQKPYKGVMYYPLEVYADVIAATNPKEVKACIVNRNSVYIPVALQRGIDPVYLVLHDIVTPGTIIPLDARLRKVFCLSQWHKHQFLKFFPQFANRVDIVSYGLDLATFPRREKVPYRFIFPSFPNRGLLPLLRMFPKIVQKYPSARLDVFCDMNNPWIRKHYGETIKEIDKLLHEQTKHVTNHGWVNRDTLREFWARAHVWFYPCTFEETCCLTAYEAAASETLVVTNHLAALAETVGDRGIIIPGDPLSEGWQIMALNRLFNVLDIIEPSDHVKRNREWAETKAYDVVVNRFWKNL